MTIDRPNEPGFYYERTSGKYFRVFKSDSGSLLADEYGDDYRTLKWLTELPATGNWQKLGVPVTAGEADKQFREWLTQSKHCPCGIHRCMDIADKAAEIFCSVSPEERSREDSQAIVQRVLAGAAKMAGEVDQIAGLKSELKDALHECESRGAILDGAKEATGATWWMGIAEWANLVFAACKRADSNPNYCSKITPALVPAYIGQLAKERDHANRMYQTAADTGADQITTLKQTIARLEGEVAEAKRERNNFENAADHLAADANRFQGSLQKLRDVASSHGWDEGLTHGDLGTWIDERLNELTPQPEVIEGKGQAAEGGWYWHECRDSQPQVVYKMPGDSLFSGVRYIKISEPTFPKPAFVAPEKPELVLVRLPDGTMIWAKNGWLNGAAGCVVLNPETGEPIAKEES